MADAPETPAPAASPPLPGNRVRAIGLAAAVIMAGNLATSGLGFVRQAATVHVFGTGVATDAWFAASIVPQMFYDLAIGAAISAALIPTFTEIAERDGMPALGRTVGTVLGIVWLVLGALVLALVAFAPGVMTVLLHAYKGNTNAVSRSVDVVRILVPSLLFLGSSAVFLSALYAVRRYRAPAFATMFYHLGVIAGAVFLARPLGILALPVGAVAGAAAQAAVQLPALIRSGLHLRIRIEWTPAVRRILRLYLPVSAGLLVSVAGQIADLNLKASIGPHVIGWMSLATTLTQFPIGIGVAALGFAVLPSISSDAAFARPQQFKDTLSTGMRLVLFLTVPAAIGFLAAATPIVRLIFETGRFHAADTTSTVSALTGYAFQIPFVGIDQLLIFAFYARQNTITPMFVGVGGVALYVVSALLLIPHLHVFGLALANTIQNSTHALVLLALLVAAIGPFGGKPMALSIARTIAAGIVMGIVAALVGSSLSTLLGTAHLSARLAAVAAILGAAALSYLGAARLLRSEELMLVTDLLRSRLLPSRS